METVKIVLERELLQAARRTKQNRSALVREALRQHLRRLEILELEERDREGYRRIPEDTNESAMWEAAAAWPEE